MSESFDQELSDCVVAFADHKDNKVIAEAMMDKIQKRFELINVKNAELTAALEISEDKNAELTAALESAGQPLMDKPVVASPQIEDVAKASWCEDVDFPTLEEAKSIKVVIGAIPATPPPTVGTASVSSESNGSVEVHVYDVRPYDDRRRWFCGHIFESDDGKCPHGNKCFFAHRKEELTEEQLRNRKLDNFKMADCSEDHGSPHLIDNLKKTQVCSNGHNVNRCATTLHTKLNLLYSQ